MITFSFSPCVGIKEKVNPSSLAIWPNPNQGIFTLKAEPVTGPFRLLVVNLLGVVVHEEEIMARPGKLVKDLDFSDLRPGVYFIRIPGQQGDRTLKLVVR